MIDLTIQLPGGRFNHRVTGVCIHQECLLVHRSQRDDFWTLPGGRIQLHENSEHALRREMIEELGLTINQMKLLWFAENFFTYDEEKYHEVGMYYLCELPDLQISPEENFYGKEGERLIYRWQPIQKLKGIKIRPDFVQAEIHHLEFRHLVQRDG